MNKMGLASFLQYSSNFHNSIKVVYSKTERGEKGKQTTSKENAIMTLTYRLKRGDIRHNRIQLL